MQTEVPKSVCHDNMDANPNVLHFGIPQQANVPIPLLYTASRWSPVMQCALQECCAAAVHTRAGLHCKSLIGSWYLRSHKTAERLHLASCHS